MSLLFIYSVNSKSAYLASKYLNKVCNPWNDVNRL